VFGPQIETICSLKLNELQYKGGKMYSSHHVATPVIAPTRL